MADGAGQRQPLHGVAGRRWPHGDKQRSDRRHRHRDQAGRHSARGRAHAAARRRPHLQAACLKKGNARIEAKRGAAVDVALEVDTKDKKTVRVTFNFVRDSTGHHTRRVPASAGHWVATMNYIYGGQANIHVVRLHSRHVRVPVDLGPEVTWDASPGSEWNTVTALGDPGADLNYFLVWAYEQYTTPGDGADAGTLAGNCIFEDNAGTAVGVSMAHEMGHFLGRNDHYVAARRLELMYGITDQRGIHLPKADINVMNP